MSHIHIDIENLSFSYDNDSQVLSGISFHAGENESIGIIGANGAGKSTLLKLMAGLYTDFKGSIRIEEIPVEKKTLKLIREKIGYVFQDSDSQLFMPVVKEDVAFGPRNYGLPEDEVKKRVNDSLKKVNALHLADRPVYQLSYGEKKLVAIASVLAMIPDIILMDEPSAALDPRNRRNLIELLNGFEHLKIITSHDIDFVEKTCQRVILIADGTIVADGPAKDILHNEALLIRNGL